MRKEQFDITGMTCSACSSRVESCVRKLPGVKDVSVNLLKNSMSVSYDENGMNTEGIVGADCNRDCGDCHYRLADCRLRLGVRSLSAFRFS